MNTLNLDLSSVIQLTDDSFFQLCQPNRNLKLERTAVGKIIIMPPTGGEIGKSILTL